ncbi:MAG TPA: MFS transporter [Polyangia bacterium]|nr:MFS transporter [Polyangia bacterium]
MVAKSDRSADRAFAQVTLATCIYFVGLALFFILPRRLVELAADPRQVGLYMGLQGVAPLVVMPLVGTLADRKGTRPILLGGFGLSTVVAAGYFGLTRLGPYLALLRLLGGAGFGGSFAAGSIFAARVAPPGKLAQRIGIFGAGTLLTHAIGPPLGEALVERWGWNALYGVATVLMGAGFALVVSLRDPPLEPAAGDSGWRAVAASPGIWTPYLVSFVAAGAWGALFTFLPAWTAARGRHVSPFFTSYALSALAVRVLVGDLADRVGRRRAAAPALLGYAAAVAATGFARGPAGLVAIGLFFGATHGVHYPALAALALDRAPAAVRGRAMSLFNLAFTLGSMAGSFAYGAVAKRVGYPAMFAAAGAISLVAALMLVTDRLLQSRRARVT